MKTNKHFILLFVLSSIFSCYLFSQDQTISLHPSVGKTIGKTEKKKHDLFYWIPDHDFKSAVVHQKADTLFFVRIYLRNGTHQDFPLKNAEVISIKEKLSGLPEFGNAPDSSFQQHKIKRKLTLHPTIGTVLSPSEIKKYKLEKYFNGDIKSVEFFEMQEKYVQQRIRYSNGKIAYGVLAKSDYFAIRYSIIPAKSQLFSESADTTRVVVTLHKKIGPKISKREKRKYNLFENVNDSLYKHATLYRINKQQYELAVRYKNNVVKKQILNKKEIFLEHQKAYGFYYPAGKDTVQIIKTNETKRIITAVDSLSNRFVYCKGDSFILESVLQIKNVPATSIINNQYWYPNPNPTRYLFAPSAFPMKKKEQYYQNTMVLLNAIQWGVTDRFSFGLGMDLISIFSGKLNFYLTPKYSIRISEKTYVAPGALILARIEEKEFVSLAYTVFTYGSSEEHVSFGTGWGVVNARLQEQPVFTLCYSKRINRTFGIISENWYLPLTPDFKLYLLSLGTRHIMERSTVDIALVYNPELFGAMNIPMPFVTYQLRF